MPLWAIELYADGIDGGDAVSLPMERWRQLEGSPGGYEYRATAPAARGAKEYRARLVPHHRDAAIPREASEIRWQD